MQAIDRRESVEIYYRGKQKALMIPLENKVSKQVKISIKNHPYCSMDKDIHPIDQVMDSLRGGRYHDL